MYLYNNNWCDNLLLDIDKSEQIVRFLDAVVIKMEGGTDLDLKVLDNESEDEEEGEEGKSSSSSSEDEDEEKTKNADDPAKELEMDMTSKERELQKKAKEFLKKKHENQEGFDEDEEDSGAEADREPADQVLPVNGIPDEETAEEEKPKSDEQAESKEKDEVQNGENKTEEGEKTEEASEPPAPKPNKPRALHRTLSIFLRNLAPSITKQEVEAMCKRFPGYLRVALSDPAPERKFFRRGWVTFTRDVNIKEICWNLNNIRLRDCEMGPIVNRDLQRRIRPVNGITAHRQIVKNDIKYASKIICVFDNKRSLWADEGHEKNEKEKEQAKFGVNTRNPLLKDITDYFIDEMSAEEEELLGKSEDADKSESTIERDNILCAVLDKLILYLRVVHSLDYYNTSEYPLEDEMPNRCGIMHGRGPTPINPVTQDEITEFIDSFAAKIEPFLESEEALADDESLSLGKKDPEIEVEKFIQANTQELGKDKWLCPLSGKKFKGPEFIRKHLLNKHSEKLDEVRAEVEYFNNYLMDLKRPTSASEAPKPSQSMTSYSGGGPHQGGPPGGGYQPRPPMPPTYNHYGGGGYQSRGGYGGPYGGRENYSGYRGGMRGRGGGMFY